MKTVTRSVSFRLLAHVALALGVAMTSFACSGEDAEDGTGGNTSVDPETPYCAPAASCPVDAAGEDLTTAVSFRTNVFPIFQATCNNVGCHGRENGSFGDLYLGPSTGTPTDDQVAQIINVLTTKSPEATDSMPLVNPGVWADSFLMLKVDGCQNEAGLTCTKPFGAVCDGACGDGMPQFGPSDDAPYPLSAEDRRIIRAWIAQGAPDN